MKMYRLKRFAALLLALLLAVGGLSVAAAEGTAKKVTVMVYMCGSDLEMSHGQGTQSISDMLASRFNTDAVNVILLLGGTPKWTSGYDSSELTVLELTGRRPRSVTSFASSSMGESGTLTDFLNFCHDNYPAERYDLVMWDHGGGPLSGVCVDLLYKDASDPNRQDMLNMHELAAALDASPFADRGLELLVFHACLMGSAEVAAIMAPYAHYMVGSEDSMYGLSYDWFAGLENDESGLDTAKRLVDASFEFNGDTIQRQQATEINAMSVVDLTAIDKVTAALDVFFDGVPAPITDADFTAMSNQRRDTVAFGVGSSGNDTDYDLIDLGDLIQKYSDINPEGAKAVQDAIDSAVVYRRVSLDNCSGITVYHPYYNRKELTRRIGIYNGLGFSQSYTAYLQNFTAVLTGTPLADWTNLLTGVPGPSKDNRVLFTLALSDEQAAQYGDSVLDVLKKGEDGSYTFTFANVNTAMDEQNGLTGEFSGTALYAADESGAALSQPLEYRLLSDGRYLVPATLIKHGEEGEEDAVKTVLITCAPSEADRKQLIPGSVQVWEEAIAGYTIAGNTTLEDYDEIILTSTARAEKRDESGALLAFDLWDAVSETAWSNAVDGSWHFELLNDTLDTTELYASFQVCDSQNNIYSSELKVVKDEIGKDDDDVLRVAYDDANLVLINSFSLPAMDGALTLTGRLQNLTDREVIIKLENLVVEGVAVDATAEIVGTGENWGLLPGEEQPLYLSVDAADLPEAISRVTFDLTLADAATEEILGTVPVEVSKTQSL